MSLDMKHELLRTILDAVEEKGLGVLDSDGSNYSESGVGGEWLVIETESGFFRITVDEVPF